MASQGISRRKGTTDHGSSYEQKVAALLGVKCALNDDIQNMWMATNVDKLGAFDDLVLFIERRNSKEMYLIQIKHKKNKPISLTSGTNDLKKYQESFLKIQQDFDNDTSPLKNSCNFQDIKFLLFTNTQIDMNQTKNITLSACPNTGDFINTGKILKISHDPQSTYEQSFLKQMFFYTKQVGVSKIENVLKNKVGNFKNCDVQQITKFFENWHSEYFENKIVLKKEDIQSVILQTVLSYYIPEPIVTNFPNAAIWNEVVSQFEFVFIQDECHLAKIWQAVNLQICNFLGDQNLSIKTWKEPLQRPSNKINKIKQHLQNQEVLIRKDKSSYSTKDLYLLLWQFCEIPLILNLKINDSQGDIRTALVKLNSSRGNKRRYIFLGKATNNFLQYYKPFNIFSVHGDIRKKILKNTYVSLQNKKAVTLEKLNLNSTVLEKMSPNVLIELLQPAAKTSEVNHGYVPRFIRQPTLSTNVLSIREAVFVIVTEVNVPERYILFNRFGPHMSWSIYKLHSKEFSKKVIINGYNPKFVTCITLNNDVKNFKEFIYIENIIKEIREYNEQTVHYFRLLNKNQLIWLHSNQNADQIKPFLIPNSEEYLSDSKLFHYLSFNILSGNAGEGKSVLLEFIANDCPAEVWVIKLNIREITEYIEKDDFSTIKTFLYDQSNNFNKHNEFYRELFENLYEERNMLVIVDGIDEIVYNSKIRGFLNAVKSLGIKTIIAARPTLRNSLEKQFHMLSLFFKPLTNKDCRLLIELTLQNKYKDIDTKIIKGFLKKIYSWNNILGVPLLLKLYVSLLSNENVSDISKLDLSDLFDKYINEQLEKVTSCNASTMRTLSRSALFVLYNENALSELFVINEYLEDIEDKIKIYKKSKLIEKLNNNNVPVFAHKSLAEFLTAKYLSNLAKNSNNVPDNFLKSLFYKELEIVRFFFDIMILKDSGLQDIITSNSHSYICDKMNYSVDKFGRNGMDIAASYGNRCELRITQLLWSGVNIYESYNDIFCGNIIRPCQEFERKPIVPVHIVDKLLQNGLDPFKKDNLFKMDVFDFAIESGSLETIDLLFSRNFIKPLENINHDILLYIAVKNGYINIFRQLRNKNLDLKILPARDNLLHVALSSENFEIIKELTESRIPIDELNIIGYSALINWLFSSKFMSSGTHRISQLNNDQVDILDHLFDKNVNLNIVNDLGETPLHAFCCSQTASVVEKLIQNGADVNKKTKLGNIPLHYASQFSLENVKLLLKSKSNIDIPNVFGHTPLCLAAQNNQQDILKYLIKKGANVNGNKKFASPLNNAVLNGHVDCVELLIKRGAKINNSNINNTLELAVSFGHLNCVKFLINYKAKIFIGLVNLAISHHHIDIIKFLFTECKISNQIKKEITKSFFSRPVDLYDIDIIDTLMPFGLDINAKMENGNTALHRASVFGLVNIIEHLIKCGSKVNVENDYCITPLTLAAEFNYLEIIKIYIKNGSDLQKYGPDTIFVAAREGYDDILDYVISKGADINKTNSRGNAPIHGASETNLNCVRNLTQRGADVNLKTPDSAVTPLMIAASKGFKEILEYLVENNAKLDELNINRQSALILASREGHLECVQFLIGKGSDVDKHGPTAIYCALHGDHFAVADYLISVGADINGTITDLVNAPIHHAVLENNLKAVKYLINKGADVNSRVICDGNTPLIIAAFNGSKEILEYLVENNAKLDEPNKNRHTALIVASREGHLECVQFLIGKGSVVGKHGPTAIYCALHGDHVAVADYLISVGADINGTPTGEISAPIHQAVVKNNLKVVKYLINKGADVNSRVICDGNTPLIIAAFNGSKEILEYLVENNAKLDEPNKNRYRALIVASQEGHLECVKLLINKGSDIHKYGLFAIYIAALRKHTSVVKFLVSVAYGNSQ